jgi:hypothetical protein
VWPLTMTVSVLVTQKRMATSDDRNGRILLKTWASVLRGIDPLSHS